MTHDRFTVSTEGLRELHANREPWALLKELVQNAWDEAPQATTCTVTILPAKPRGVQVHVFDDGPGFADISHAFTLLAQTEKRTDPKKRGRFNLGEKEVISVAREATIETVGKTVRFPRGGGRKIVRNQRQRGTLVSALMPWRHDQIRETVAKLRQFRPTDCRFIVNGEEIPQRKPVAVARAVLPTVVFDPESNAMNRTYRATDIDVLDRADKDEAWLYELGIPVQTVDLGFDVDVLQKIPLPPNRDTVSASYIRELCAHVLNVTHDQISEDGAAESWVGNALDSSWVSEEAVKATVKKRYGRKVALWSSNTDANLQAAEAGYEVLHPRSLTPGERDNLKEKGGVVSTNAIFGHGPPTVDAIPAALTPARDEFAEWVVSLGEIVNLNVTVLFINNDVPVDADCSGHSSSPTIRFNIHHLSEAWFRERGAAQYELIVHEFAHAVALRALEHGPAWGKACTKVAGLLLEDLKETS